MKFYQATVNVTFTFCSLISGSMRTSSMRWRSPWPSVPHLAPSSWATWRRSSTNSVRTKLLLAVSRLKPLHVLENVKVQLKPFNLDSVGFCVAGEVGKSRGQHRAEAEVGRWCKPCTRPSAAGLWGHYSRTPCLGDEGESACQPGYFSLQHHSQLRRSAYSHFRSLEHGCDTFWTCETMPGHLLLRCPV